MDGAACLSDAPTALDLPPRTQKARLHGRFLSGGKPRRLDFRRSVRSGLRSSSDKAREEAQAHFPESAAGNRAYWTRLNPSQWPTWPRGKLLRILSWNVTWAWHLRISGMHCNAARQERVGTWPATEQGPKTFYHAFDPSLFCAITSIKIMWSCPKFWQVSHVKSGDTRGEVVQHLSGNAVNHEFQFYATWAYVESRKSRKGSFVISSVPYRNLVVVQWVFSP